MLANNTAIIEKFSTYTVLDEDISFSEKLKINVDTGEEIFDEILERENDIVLYDIYKKKKGLLTSKEIKTIREAYGIGQTSFARILGLGDITITRYENGSIQEKASDNLIKIAQTPEGMLILLENNKNKISEKIYEKVKNIALNKNVSDVNSSITTFLLSKLEYTADIYSGFKGFDIDKFINITLYFIENSANNYRTKINKLLFYADYKAFNLLGTSLTGCRYIRNHYGPTPLEFELLFSEMFEQGYLEYSYDDFGNELFVNKVNSDLSYFSNEEKAILQTVLNKFQNTTAQAIKNASHKEAAWLNTPHGNIISYSYANSLSTI